MQPDFLLLHVRDPLESAAFYAARLSAPVLETSPTFALVPLNDSTMLGLWKMDGVKPAAGPAGGAEIAVTLESDAAVDALHDAWTAEGVTILAAPFDLDFGRSFVAADPDGHRIRAFAPRRP